MKTQQTIISSEQEDLNERLNKLMNRFNILTFINQLGLEWSIGVLERNDGWNREKYIHCFDGENN